MLACCGGPIGNIPENRPLLPGDTVTSPTYLCAGYKTEWWICPPDYVANNEGVLEENLAGACELVDSGSEYLVTAAAAGKHIVAIGRCPDPSAPDGFGPATGATTTDQVGGEDSDQGAITADPPEATEFEVIMNLDDPYNQYRYITSITGPIFYLEVGSWELSGQTYNRRIRLRWTAVNGTVIDVVPGFWVYRRDPPAFTLDNKPWGCRLEIAATGEPWPFI